MAEITRPHITPKDLESPEDVARQMRLIIDFVAQQTVKQAAEAERTYLKKGARIVADAMRVMEGEVSFDKATRPEPGFVLYAADGTYAVFGSSASPAPTDPGTGPDVVSTHVILDSTVHTDTLTGTVVRGDLFVGNATPKWSRLARPASASVAVNDGTDVVYRTIPTRLFNDGLIDATEWESISTVPATKAMHGTEPDSYLSWDFDAVADYWVGKSITIPQTWASGVVTVKVLWTTSGAGATNWVPYLRYLARVDGDDVTAAGTTITGPTTSANFAADLLKITTLGTFTPAAAGRFYRLSFGRQATTDANDNYLGTIRFVGLVIEFTPVY
jgi:hypothetical protein